MRSPAPAESGTARSLERGLLTNALGILVKASRTLYLILFGHVLGAAGFGTYLLAFAVQEAVSKFAILGLNWGGKQLVGRLIADGHGDSTSNTAPWKGRGGPHSDAGPRTRTPRRRAVASASA